MSYVEGPSENMSKRGDFLYRFVLGFLKNRTIEEVFRVAYVMNEPYDEY